MNKSFLNYINSQKLQKYGIKSDSGFFYNKRSKELHWHKDLFLGMLSFDASFVPAYTDADLMDILPGKICFKKDRNYERSYELIISKSGLSNDKYFCEYKNTNLTLPSLGQQFAKSEVESKALMIIFLIKKDLIEF